MTERDLYFCAEQPAPAPHLAHPEGCDALRILLVTVPRVSRACQYFPDGFDLHLLHVDSDCTTTFGEMMQSTFVVVATMDLDRIRLPLSP